MMCVGHNSNLNPPPIYKKFIENNKQTNKCIHTNSMLENGFVNLCWAFQFYIIYASTTYTKKLNHEPIMPLLHVKSLLTL